MATPDSSQESHSLVLSNPQIWGQTETDDPGTCASSSSSAIENQSSFSWILYRSSRRQQVIEAIYKELKRRNTMWCYSCHTHEVTKGVRGHGEFMLPLEIFPIVQFNHFKILLPHCSPQTFFILEKIQVVIFPFILSSTQVHSVDILVKRGHGNRWCTLLEAIVHITQQQWEFFVT